MRVYFVHAKIVRKKKQFQGVKCEINVDNCK